MQRLLSIIILASLSLAMSAQDKIIKKDYTLLIVKIHEIGDDYVLYRKLDASSGPDYRISAANIGKVILENGEEITFSRTAVSTAASKHTDKVFDETVLYPNAGVMERWRNSYTLDGELIPANELVNYIGQKNFNEVYVGAVKQKKAGTALMAIGGGLMAVGTVFTCVGDIYGWESYRYDNGYGYGYRTNEIWGLLPTGIVFMSVGGASMIAGIPLYCVGNGRMNWIAEDYNAKSKNYSYTPSLNITGCRNGFGLGLALNF